MLKPFRTNRPLTRLIAMVIFMASVLPVIGHVCMMTAQAAPTMESCCCHKAGDIGLAMVDGRECDDEIEHGTSVQEVCCTASLQSIDSNALARTSKASLEENMGSVPLLQVAFSISEPAPPRIERRFFDTGPPPPLPSLRILHSRFLI